MSHYAYILRCSDGSLYVGSTGDLDERLRSHNDGRGSSFTARRLPVTLAFADKFGTGRGAAERERQLKGWSRAKKEALIAGNTQRLRRLAKAARKRLRNSALNRTGRNLG